MLGRLEVYRWVVNGAEVRIGDASQGRSGARRSDYSPYNETSDPDD